jgi:hypothetical protein
MGTVKRVYTFGDKRAEGKADMKNLLGGKGANLAEMNLIGVPVPPGLTITTEVCTEYNQIGKEKIIEILYEEVKQVRSGSRASMPGMMDTVLNWDSMMWLWKVLPVKQAMTDLPGIRIAALCRCLAMWYLA